MAEGVLNDNKMFTNKEKAGSEQKYLTARQYIN